MWQKRPVHMAKEACSYGEGGLFIWQRGLFIWQKRPISGLRPLLLYSNRLLPVRKMPRDLLA